MDLKALNELKPVKSLLLGDRSQGVVLLERGVVKKTYNKTSKAHVERYDLEVAVLKRLQGCPYVPRLYATDDANKIMYMQYVGKNVKLNRTQKKTVKRILRLFGERYHVFRVKDGKAKYSYKDLFPANICVDDAGNVRLIDFGGLWRIDDKHYKKLLSH